MEKKLAYKVLIDLVQTTEDVSQLVEQIESVLGDLYRNDFVLDSVLSAQVSSRFFSPLQEIVHQSGIVASDRDKIKVLFDSIMAEVRSLSFIHITLAFDPTQLLLTEIVQRCRKNIVEGCVLDVTIDKHIIGGFVLDYKGHYWDFSLRTSFERFFAGGNLIYLVQRNI